MHRRNAALATPNRMRCAHGGNAIRNCNVATQAHTKAKAEYATAKPHTTTIDVNVYSISGMNVLTAKNPRTTHPDTPLCK